MRCPALLDDRDQWRKGPWRTRLRQILRAEAWLGAWACSVWRRYSEGNAGAGGHLGHLGTTVGGSRRSDVLEWMRRLLQSLVLTILGKTRLLADTSSSGGQKEQRCCQPWLPGLGDPSCSRAPGPSTVNLDFSRKIRQTQMVCRTSRKLTLC